MYFNVSIMKFFKNSSKTWYNKRNMEVLIGSAFQMVNHKSKILQTFLI